MMKKEISQELVNEVISMYNNSDVKDVSSLDVLRPIRSKTLLGYGDIQAIIRKYCV